MTVPLIQFDSIVKRFAGITALDGVSLSIAAGEVHALMGENGAGKSTLGKVLAGIHRAEAGRILIAGQEVHFRSPADARAAGIGMVHQELAFCPDLSIAENLCMGHYPRRLGMVDRRAMADEARRLLQQIGVELDVTRLMRSLSTGQEQLIQIAAAVGTGARILIFDEPTSSLCEAESQSLFELIESLRTRGVTMIYVSHRMPEVFRLCDRISVLRDGKYVGTLQRDEADQDRIVHLMIGRTIDLAMKSDPPQPQSEQPALRVQSLRSPGKFQDISFAIRPGEIVGFAGLVGSGRSEIAQAIFGLDKNATGSVDVAGVPLKLGSTREALRRGIGLVPEDRKRQGLVLMMGCRKNFSLAMLDRLKRLGMLDHARERREAAAFFDKLRVKTATLDTPVETLSGGNQQKVVLAKWLGRGGKILIVDEPTRGVDVGTKAAIHQIITDLARQGVAVMLISSEMPEVLRLSTRILIMREGRLAGELPAATATQDKLLRLMAGVEAAGALV
ncbi:MAG TPA: sugar ABC transporter ATP-binding protein [Tepidisphaeraceae bacterium]|nr:sugar ABC transporter ATP-binding protein [Tepidisphaeraceae bacterium]